MLLDSQDNDKRIDSEVFPIAIGEQSPTGDVRWDALLGTGFSISDDGWCLTAAHVLEGVLGHVFAAFPAGNEWRAFTIAQVESHPTEDLAVFRVVGRQLAPFCGWVPGQCHASREYFAFGYPHDLLKDHGRPQGPYGAVPDRPELIISRGHVRRRYSHPTPGLRGMAFAELSDWVAQGGSGGPVTCHGTRNLIGVYLGHRCESLLDPDNHRQLVGARGIALRIDDCVRWAPSVAGGQTLETIFRKERAPAVFHHLAGPGI